MMCVWYRDRRIMVGDLLLEVEMELSVEGSSGDVRGQEFV
jgi:hypothetical protein